MHAHYLSDPLWLKPEAMDLDEPDVPVPFSQRLSLETGWTPEETAEAIGIYKRFIYLMATSGRRFDLPSRVDTTWRLHLTYTRHYRTVLCGDALGEMLHYHESDESGGLEKANQAYRAVFGQNIPRNVKVKKEFENRGEGGNPTVLLGLLYAISIAVGLELVKTQTAIDGAHVVGFVCLVLVILSPLVFRITDRTIARSMAGCDIPLFPYKEGRARLTLEASHPQQEPAVHWHAVEAFIIDLARRQPQSLVEDDNSRSKLSVEATMRSAGEYARFIYLLRTAAQPLTPSLAIDDVWHAHLMATRSYWDELCGKILGVDLHHEPGTGQAGDMHRHFIQYCRVWISYRRVFGTWPPRSHWPYPVHPLRPLAPIVLAVFVLTWIMSLMFGDAAVLPGLLAALAASTIVGYLTYRGSQNDAKHYRVSLMERSDRSRPSSCG